jgi:hypothetical protein
MLEAYVSERLRPRYFKVTALVFPIQAKDIERIQIVLNGRDSSIKESNLEIFIAIFAGTLMHMSIGIISSRYESTI